MRSGSFSCPTCDPAIQVPYGAWYGDRVIGLPVPDTWTVHRLDPADGPALRPEQIEAALQTPFGTPTIREMARRATSAILVVEDITRPTKVELILPGIIRQLQAGGLPDERIRILLAAGAHRPMTTEEVERKIPPRVRGRIEVHVHDFMGDDLAFLGWRHGGPVYLNRLFLQADLRICIGAVLPHNETGFGGGAKLIIPGVAGRQTIAFLHGALPPRLRGLLDPSDGQLDRRSWLEAVVRQVGLDVAVCAVVNATRDIAGLFVGDAIQAHRMAARCAGRIGRTRVPAGIVAAADAVLVNAYPLDTDPIQMGKGINTSKAMGVKNTIVVHAASDGIFYHGMGMGSGVQWSRLARNLITSPARPWDLAHFARGACRLRRPSLLARYAYFCCNHLSYPDFLRSAPTQRDNSRDEYASTPDGILVYSPRFPAWGFRQRYPGGCLFRDWSGLCLALMRRIAREKVHLLVLPCAPLQLPYIENDL